jgi:hypothetical protein
MNCERSVDERSILEVKETLGGERREYACTLLSLTADEAVLLYRLPRAGRVADLAPPAGTLSLGHFWVARPYNAYHWLTPDGRTLGLYVNLSDRTRLAPDRVTWRDLVVDLLVTPDGRCRVLDEDELPAGLDPALRATIAAARERVLREQGELLAEVERRSASLLLHAGGGRQDAPVGRAPSLQ